MTALLIGYARVSTDAQDVTGQRDALDRLGVAPERIYVDHGLTGTNRDRPGLRTALAVCRDGDTLVVTKLDRLARSLPDAREIIDDLTKRHVKPSLGGSLHDPTDPIGRLLFNVLLGRRVRVRPHPAPHPRGHEGRQGQGPPPRQATQAQPAPGGTPRRPAPRRRAQHRRTRQAVRRRPLQCLPRDRPRRPCHRSHHDGSCPLAVRLTEHGSRRSDGEAVQLVLAKPMRCPSGSVKWPTTKSVPGTVSGPMRRVPPRDSACWRAASTSGTPT